MRVPESTDFGAPSMDMVEVYSCRSAAIGSICAAR